MSMTDLQNDRAAMNAAIENYKTVLAGFKANDGTTQADVEAARLAAEQAGKTYADRIQTERKANPGLAEDDFFSNPTLMTAQVRDNVGKIMTTGQLARGMVWLIQTDRNNPNKSNVSLYFSSVTEGSTIDWGDGVVEPLVAGYNNHTYPTPGEYRMTFTGEGSAGSAVQSADRDWLVDVEQWGTDWKMSNWSYMFYARKNLNISASDSPTIDPGTSMQRMFQSTQFGSVVNLSHLNVVGVVDMSYMFYGCTGMSDDLSGWDVSGVTSSAGFAQSTDIPLSRQPTF